MLAHAATASLSPEEALDLELLHSALSSSRHVILERPMGGESSCQAKVDMSSLRSVRRLQMRRVAPREVRGLTSKVRHRMEALEITRSRGIDVEKELLILSRDPQASSPYVWPKLTRLCLPRCGLTKFPATLATHMPALQALDISFNELEELPGVSGLSRLKRLLAGYNRLRSIPDFRGHAGRTLQVLWLPFNRLTSVEGVGEAARLKDLDVSFNLLVEHADLGHVCLLPRLVRLNTSGNALTRNKDHRELALAFAHPEVDIGIFSLDQRRLSDREAFMVGLARVVPPLPQPRGHNERPRSPAALEDDYVSSSVVSSVAVGGARPKVRTSIKRRGKRVREANIGEPEVASTNEERDAMLAKKYAEPQGTPNAQHLTVKRKIEELRANFGENDWLQGQAGDSVQRALGLPTEDSATISELIAARLSEFDANEERLVNYVAEQQSLSKPVIPRLHVNSAGDQDVQEEKDERKAVQSSMSSSLDLANKEDQNVMQSSFNQEMQSSFYGMYNSQESLGKESAGHDTEEENTLVLAVRASGPEGQGYQELSLVWAGDFIRERNQSGLILSQWFTHHLEACDFDPPTSTPTDSVSATLDFSDGRGSSRTKRRYVMSGEDAAKLESVVTPILEAQRRHILRLGAMQCLRCSTEFTEDVNKSSKQHFCPNCGSAMVIRLEGPPKEISPSMNSLNEDSFKENMKDTSTPHKKNRRCNVEDQEDNGEGLSSSLPKMLKRALFERGPLVRQKNSRDSQTAIKHQGELSSFPNANGKSVSQSPPATATRASSHLKSGDGSSSDISVLSNPSQASIEVLPQGGKAGADQQASSAPKGSFPFPNGDHDDEEVEVLSRDHEDDDRSAKASAVTLLAKTMGESSSSGSMADSIVTAREVGTSKEVANNSDADRTVKNEDIELAVEMAEDVLDSLDGIADVFNGQPNQFQRAATSNPQQSLQSLNASTDESYRTALSDLSLNMVTADSTLTNNSAAEDSDASISSAGGRRRLGISRAAAVAAASGAAGLRQMAGPMSLLGSAFKGTSSGVIVEGQKLPDDVDDSVAVAPTVMEWDFSDFSHVDHRLKLHIELTYCDEAEETVLLSTKVRVLTKSGGKLFLGVVVVTNRKVQILRAIKAESEDANDWLRPVETHKVGNLRCLQVMLGGQALGLHLSPPTAASNEQTKNTLVLLFGDEGRTERFATQLTQFLLENVSSSPVQSVDRKDETKVRLIKALAKCSNGKVGSDSKVSCFLLGSYRQDGIAKRISFTLAGPHCFITSNFIKWDFLKEEKPLALRNMFAVSDITQIDVYEAFPASLRLTVRRDSTIVLDFETEDCVVAALKALKETWRQCKQEDIEELFVFNMERDGQLRLRHLSDPMDASVTQLSEWIQVIKKKLSA